MGRFKLGLAIIARNFYSLSYTSFILSLSLPRSSTLRFPYKSLSKRSVHFLCRSAPCSTALRLARDGLFHLFQLRRSRLPLLLSTNLINKVVYLSKWILYSSVSPWPRPERRAGFARVPSSFLSLSLGSRLQELLANFSDLFVRSKQVEIGKRRGFSRCFRERSFSSVLSTVWTSSSDVNSLLRKLFQAPARRSTRSFVNCGFSRFQSPLEQRYRMNSSLQISMNSINSTRCSFATIARPNFCLIFIYLENDRSPLPLNYYHHRGTVDKFIRRKLIFVVASYRYSTLSLE